MSIRSESQPNESGDDIEPYMEVVGPEPSVEQRLGLYATYRGMGGKPIKALEQLRAEADAHESEAA